MLQGSADAEHKELKEGLAKALAKARDLTKVSGVERFGFADVKVIKVFTGLVPTASAPRICRCQRVCRCWMWMLAASNNDKVTSLQGCTVVCLFS